MSAGVGGVRARVADLKHLTGSGDGNRSHHGSEPRASINGVSPRRGPSLLVTLGMRHRHFPKLGGNPDILAPSREGERAFELQCPSLG